MLNRAEKLHEKLSKSKLNDAISTVGDYSPKQYGLRAFNSVRWCQMFEALENFFNIVGYLLQVLRYYFKDPAMLY